MKSRTCIAALLCAALLNGCGTTTSNESSLRIELVTDITTNAPAVSVAASSASSDTTSAAAAQTVLTSSKSAVSTGMSESSTTSETTLTETTEPIQTTPSETAAAQTETEAPVEKTEAPVQTTTAEAVTTPPPAPAVTTQKTTVNTVKKSLFEELKPTVDCTAYVKSHIGFTLQEDVSCHGEGTDRVYTYPDYTIYTFFHDGIDEVWELAVTAPGIALDTGIEVGMTKADVIAKYGASDSDSYPVNAFILSFIYDDADKIDEISLMQQEE